MHAPGPFGSGLDIMRGLRLLGRGRDKDPAGTLYLKDSSPATHSGSSSASTQLGSTKLVSFPMMHWYAGQSMAQLCYSS
jgi:hypothetical protein